MAAAMVRGVKNFPDPSRNGVPKRTDTMSAIRALWGPAPQPRQGWKAPVCRAPRCSMLNSSLDREEGKLAECRFLSIQITGSQKVKMPFLFLASRYLDTQKAALRDFSFFPVERGIAALNIVAHDKQVLSILDGVVAQDPQGRELPTWYQFFLGRRFREGSGKFFTPRTIAAAMARFLPIHAGATVPDPTCGGGTFLCEASHRWGDTPCQLVGNDVDRMLVGLTELVLALSASPHHDLAFSCFNLYDVDAELRNLRGAGFMESWQILHSPFRSKKLRSRVSFSGLATATAMRFSWMSAWTCLPQEAAWYACCRTRWWSILSLTNFGAPWNGIGNFAVSSHCRKVFSTSLAIQQRVPTLFTCGRSRHITRKSRKTFFANAPTVGFPLNSRTTYFGENSLDLIASDPRVLECNNSAA